MATRTVSSKTKDAAAKEAVTQQAAEEPAAQALVETTSNLPATTSMFEDDAGAGQEGADKSSYAIPFLSVLQPLSPQVVEPTIEGIKAGLIINTITNELFSKVRVIPCAFQRRFLRWAPNRGGFRGDYSPIDVETGSLAGLSKYGNDYLMDVPAGVEKVYNDKGQPLYDHLADTRNHFVLFETADGSWQPAILSLSSTQIKKSKRFMSLISGIEMPGKGGKKFNPPSFSHIYELTVEKESNDKGFWFGVSFKLDQIVQDVDLYAKAKQFYSSVQDGAIEVAPPVQDGSAGVPDNGVPDNVDPETGEVKF